MTQYVSKEDEMPAAIPEAVILIGLQASGKSTFYKERFADTHVRINLDMLHTRHREKLLLEACHAAKQSYVIDNTNPSIADRETYIEAARSAGFRVMGYYFASEIEPCKARNTHRSSDQVVPLPGLLGTYSRLELPSIAEGFDCLHYVRIAEDGSFKVEVWSDEV